MKNIGELKRKSNFNMYINFNNMKKSILLKTRKSAMYALLFLCISLATLPNVMAQQNVTFLSAQEATSNNEQLRQLLYGMNPTVMINADGVEQSSSEAPIVAKCYNDAIDKLYGENNAFKTVKALRVYISEAGYSEIDIAKLSGFSNLEYILITFKYPACGISTDNSCVLSLVENMVNAGTSPITVLYQLIIPE